MMLEELNKQIVQEIDKQIIGEMLRDVEVRMNIAKLAKKNGCKTWDRYRPMRDFMVVMDDPQEDKTESGIWLPPSHRQGRWIYVKGTVMRVGPGKRHPKTGKITPIGVEVGQRVTYLHHYGTRLEKLPGNEQYLRMLDTEQVVGIVDEE